MEFIDWSIRCRDCKTDVLRRRKAIFLGVSELTGLLKDRLPEGVELLQVAPTDFGDGLRFLVSHPSWPRAEEGMESPIGIATLHRHDDGTITIEEIQ
jgi:hypothetical protein